MKMAEKLVVPPSKREAYMCIQPEPYKAAHEP